MTARAALPADAGERAQQTLLVADIGGTFARFALARNGALLNEPVRLERAAHASLAHACLAYLAGQAPAPARVDGAAIAAAGRVSAGRIAMTNAEWAIDAAALGEALGLPGAHIAVLNDFAALAWALPELPAGELTAIGAPRAARDGNRVILGPGTGLGVAATTRTLTGWRPLSSEGGHAGFAPETPFERFAADHASRRFGRVSWERVVSGPGLALLHEAAWRHLGTAGDAPGLDAAAVLQACARGDAPAATLAVSTFLELLGAFAGDAALMFDAAGGVVIGGGIVPRIAGLMALDGLRRRFEAKGRFSSWLAHVPLSLLQSPFAALRGAAIAYRST